MSKNYSTYKVSDFLTDDAFLGQHLKPTPASESYWQEFEQNKEYGEAVEILKSIKLGLANYEHNQLSEEAKDLIFRKIKATNQEQALKVFYRKPKFWLSSAAAVVLLGLSFYFLNKQSTYHTNLTQIKEETIEKRNSLTKEILIHLPDGSAVQLAPKSKISYPVKFSNEQRLVILSGEATFDIAKDPSRPFLVLANEVTTKVLGTRFNISAYESKKEVEVSVLEGKVSVYKSKSTQSVDNELTGVILLPNQKAIFDRESDKYDKKLIKHPSIIDQTKDSDFEFDETPIDVVFKKIEMAYGIEIEYDESLLKGCQVTGTFENESLFQKLDIITKIIGGSYEVVEGKILINSRGC